MGESLWAVFLSFFNSTPLIKTKLKFFLDTKIGKTLWKELQQLQHMLPLIWRLLKTVPFSLAI